MQIDAPQLTQVLNLLIAVGVFSSIVFGFILKLRSWQNKDVDLSVARRISPVVTKQAEIVDQLAVTDRKVDAYQKEMVEKFDRLNSSVLGHESRISYVEGRDIGRVEGYNMRDMVRPLRPQIPREEEEL